MQQICKSIGCTARITAGIDFCTECHVLNTPEYVQQSFDFDSDVDEEHLPKQRIRQFNPVNGSQDMDVFAIHQLFEIQDFSGCIQQASTKLLLSGDNPTRKPRVQDISDARDILNYWLELNHADH